MTSIIKSKLLVLSIHGSVGLMNVIEALVVGIDLSALQSQELGRDLWSEKSRAEHFSIIIIESLPFSKH